MKGIHVLLAMLILGFLSTSAFAADPAMGKGKDHFQFAVGPVQVDAGRSGATLFLFGAFCALWAQNTNRNPWLWFFLGLFFNVITVLVLLYNNHLDRLLLATSLGRPRLPIEPRT